MRKTDISVEELLAKYSDMVYRLAYSRTGNQHDAAHEISMVSASYRFGGSGN